MTLRETFNCSFQDSTMNPRSRRQRSHSWRKKDFHKAKVCFADNLETVHEVPYNYDMYNKTNGRLKLPDIDVHKYTPLICRDPYAKPSKRKHEKFADMFVSDTMKLPLIKLKKTDHDFDKISPKTKEATEISNEPSFPKANSKTSEKFQAASTLHFRYSDFMQRKMDRSASSKERMFFVN